MTITLTGVSNLASGILEAEVIDFALGASIGAMGTADGTKALGAAACTGVLGV